MRFKRRFPLAVVLAAPIAVGLLWMRAAASWRPVKVGRVEVGQFGSVDMDASESWVHGTSSASSVDYFVFWLNVGTGELRKEQPVWPTGIEGRFPWRTADVSENAPTPKTSAGEDFVLKTGDAKNPEHTFRFRTHGENNPFGSLASVRLARNSDTLVALWGERVVRWNATSRQLLGVVALRENLESSAALTRDGETVVVANLHQISQISARTGRMMRRLAPSGFLPSSDEDQRPPSFSRYGSFALYEQSRKAAANGWSLVDTRTGRALWKFDLDADEPPISVFSPDEKLLFLPISSRHIWQVREVATGKTLRTLLMLPDIQGAVPSPDGAMLYCVAGGVLYRQRAQ